MCTIMGYCGKSGGMQKVSEGLTATVSRGPDDERIIDIKDGVLGFQRLSIMGLTPEGMQPFGLEGNYVVCNGEIYGFRKMRDELIEKGYSFASDSDCEILLPLYKEYGTDMFAMLDAEFACIIYDHEQHTFIAARDPIGIRPLYYGFDGDTIVFASEAKNLVKICKKVMPFPPGYYYKDGGFHCYCDITAVENVIHDDIETVCANIHDKLVTGIKKRLDADAKVGFLLSGGLDSSLVCAIAQRVSDKPVSTFAIGMDTDAIDLKYAKQVADYIGSVHTEVIITRDDVIDSLDEVIHLLGTYDITTIRASMGMYLLCKAIHKQTDIRVLLTGEISDELFGYKYTDFAPSAEAFQAESVKRVSELHMYDVLR
ncbi:MAG: asparagine synthetase B, partial [Ruminococcus sp.]|nr:asparagine synthetase B [Ruminococcus sp.]